LIDGDNDWTALKSFHERRMKLETPTLEFQVLSPAHWKGYVSTEWNSFWRGNWKVEKVESTCRRRGVSLPLAVGT
jgi:hypothetical protein